MRCCGDTVDGMKSLPSLDLGHGVDGVSVIVPTLDEVDNLRILLPALRRMPGVCEVIVVDGGSEDGTVPVAEHFGFKVLCTNEPNRGAQLHAGALASRGAALWFVHADTVVPEEAADLILRLLDEPGIAGGNFSLRFGKGSEADRFWTGFYAQAGRLGLRYGDSACFARREAYAAAGGFSDFPLFEDLDLHKRLRRQGRFVTLPFFVETSARRYAGRPAPLVLLELATLQIGFWLGVPPKKLARWYQRAKRTRSTSKAQPSRARSLPER